MIPRSRRVTTKLFGEVMKKSGVRHSAHLSMRFTVASQGLNQAPLAGERVGVAAPAKLGPAKVACAVSKKVAARAVDRNLAKRRVLAAARASLTSLPPGSVFIFFPKKGILDISYADLEKEVRALLK